MVCSRQTVTDHVVLGALAIAVALFALLLPPAPLLFTLLGFGLPILYLTVRKPRSALAAIIPAFLFGIILAASFEYVAEINNAWIFPQARYFYLPWHILGIVPADVMVWYFLWVFFIVQYYEFFWDVPTARMVSPRIIYVVVPGVFVLATLYFLQARIQIPYAYAVLGGLTLFSIGILRGTSSYPVKKLLRTLPFLVFFFLVMEFVALKVGYWAFTGQYLYTLHVFGYAIPIEEFIFWIIGGPAIIIAYHELFVDDEL